LRRRTSLGLSRAAPTSPVPDVVIVLVLYLTLMGLVVGSFLNVVIYRVPRHLSVVRPRSACPTCHHAIDARDNIPVVSWLLLRGKCRHCAAPIAGRYPLVELATAVIFSLTTWRVGAHVDLGAYLILDAALVALALIDLEHLLLPRSIVYPTLIAVGLWLVMSAAIDHQWHRLVVAVACGAGWFVIFFLINFFSPQALGFGDVRLSAVLGLALGWWGVGVVVVGFFTANLVGAVVGVTLIATKRRARDEPIPYGVYLALGTLVALWFAPALMSHWHY